MADKKKTYYISTPIYYPSGKWHIGTCYTTIVCDAIARFKRMSGFDVFYLTGTDEHGVKIEDNAKAAGISPKAFVDEKVSTLKELWQLLNIQYDKFIRTTDDYHVKAVQKIFNKLYEQGDIYKSEYEGWYCVPCESFWTKTQLVDGKCPECGREVKLTKEESYFFRLSKYQDRIAALIKDNPEFLLPKSRQNEMLNNFLKEGLQDLAVSRTSFSWGIPVSFDSKHIVYVWVDALTNYITALGYGSDDDSLFKKYWPADIHMMGKEIVRFHSIIWPAILMALDLPMPKRVYGHGWLTLDGDKISKSKGNLVDAVALSERYGVDAVRYYLLRDIPFGSDGSYTNEALLSRINSDLVNDLGNLVKRSTAMVSQYRGGTIMKHIGSTAEDKEIQAMAEGLIPKLTKMVDELLIPDALTGIWSLVRRANKFIDETAPWVLFKSQENAERLDEVLYTLIEAIRFVGVALMPFLPETAEKILANIGVDEKSLMSFDSLSQFGTMQQTTVLAMPPLFPRLDIKKELVEMEKIVEGMNTVKSAPKQEEKQEEQKTPISIDKFAETQLKVGTVLTAEKVEKADKLLKLSVDLGEEKPRTIVSGIAKYYTPDDLIGKQVVVVANLVPCKLRGIMSEGMILCATGENDSIVIVSPTVAVPNGSEVR